MNYSRNYFDYISYVKTLNRSKNDAIYYEQHHILPRCCGGLDNPDNLILLTAREHFLAHYLLTKMYLNTPYSYKLTYAFIIMGANRWGRRYKNSRLYESQKKLFALQVSRINKGSHRAPTMTGRTYYEIWVNKYGQKEAENRLAILKSKISKLQRNRKISASTKEKMSQSKKELCGRANYINPSCKKVKCVETGETFNSQAEAALKFYGDKKFLFRVSRSIKEQKTVFNFTFIKG